jgi:NAD(P)-dependent dehydrogenase (short-subunit alcohol dehydrogenase family)
VNLELSGKTALVTGGSQGIGRAIAHGLAAEKARVAICARDKARLEEAAQEIRARTGADVVALPGDLSRLEEVNRVAAEARDRLGRLDILVNNAGAIRGGDFLKIPDEQWAGDWSLKILGYVRMARAVFPLMQSQGGGRIVNAVSPAATATARWEGLIAQQASAAGQTVQAFRAAAMSEYPLKRIATPEDIADIVCFLVSARASFITGICITVDGGATRGVFP